MLRVTLSASGDGQYRLLQGKGKLGKFNADITAGNTRHKFDGKTLLARIVGKIVLLRLLKMFACATVTGLSSQAEGKQDPALLSRRTE